MYRISRPQKSNEISMENLFNNFYPNQRIQRDFCEKGADNYLVMVDVMSGFFQVYKVKNKSAQEAILRVREWSASWGKPFEILKRKLSSYASLSSTALATTAHLRVQ